MKDKILIVSFLLLFYSFSFAAFRVDTMFCSENNCISNVEKTCGDCCSGKADLPSSKHKQCSSCIEKPIPVNEQSEPFVSKEQRILSAQYKLLSYEYFDFNTKSREDFYSRSSILLSSTLYAIKTIVLIV